jgi:hypothetical protein
MNDTLQERVELLRAYLDTDERIHAKLEVLTIYIAAVKKENCEQTLLWAEDEGEKTLARLALLNLIKESKIGRPFPGGLILFNTSSS